MVIGTTTRGLVLESLHESDHRSVSQVRRRVRAVLAARNIDIHRMDDALLVVEELVANVVDHARTDFRLTVELSEPVLRLAVRDTSPHVPRLRPHTVRAVRGRGLQLVAALSAQWGWEQHDDGKTVWALLHASAVH